MPERLAAHCATAGVAAARSPSRCEPPLSSQPTGPATAHHISAPQESPVSSPTWHGAPLRPSVREPIDRDARPSRDDVTLSDGSKRELSRG
ncbi:hypothetical protein emb_1c0029 [Coriobacteriaceae bacterium EMTCatB1]|nr:hypothetical protein emb_1c0029 [Coriobacteriaceae bacterium EMTCatB1]